MRLVCILLLICLCLPSCMSVPLPDHYAGPLPAPPAMLRDFAYKKLLPAGVEKPLRRNGKYVLRRVTLPIKADAVGEHDLVIDYYDVAGAKKKPIVLVLPILGGRNSVATYFAEHFAAHGLAAAIVHRQAKFKQADTVADMNAVFRQMVLDHMQAIDWIETRPELDAGRVGVFGISAGAIKGSLVAALDRRVKAAVLGLGGGDMAYILTHSTERGIRKRRDATLVRQGITKDAFYDAVKAEFRYDPLTFARHVDARSVLLILARFDSVVPFSCGNALRKAMGRPKTIIVPTGHYSAVVFAPWIKRVATRFLQDKLVERE